MEEKYRHFLFGIVASVGLCCIILVFFMGDEVRFDFLSFISIVILLVLFVVLAFDIVLLARILCGCHNETKWHIVTGCLPDQELRSKRKLLFHPEVTVFPSSVISYCEAVKQVEFAGSDCYFMAGSFEGCANLEYIKLPHCLERIPDNMFKNCSSLKEIIIPSTVKSIGKNAFDGCRRLTSVTFGESSKLESIGCSAFKGCKRLTSVEIPASVTSIGRGAFKGCKRLTSVKIPVGVTSIGDDAFSGCSRLSSVEIPAGVTSIGERAFDGCSGLTSVEIPAGVVDPGLFPAVTGECRVVVTGEITDSTVEKLRSMIDGMSAGAKIRLDLSQTTGLTSIGSSAFSGCSGLTSVTFGDTSEWYVTKSKTDGAKKARDKIVELNSEKPTRNAKKLVKKYADRYWYKKK